MSIFVRPADLSSERRDLLDVLKVNLPFLDHEKRFDWLYRANPDGPARSWFACQDTRDRIVGVVSVFPRSMWVGRDLKNCGQVGDFATAVSHRSLGPSLLMQRATFEPVNAGIWAFCYDCPPHDAGMSTFRRLGMEANSSMARYALPLRVDRLLESRLGRNWSFLSAVGNFILKLYVAPPTRIQDVEIKQHTGPFGEEFSALDESIKDEHAIRGARSAAHLNWRYLQDPLQQYEVLTARRDGELLAYLVLCIADGTATVVDLFGKEISTVGASLISAVVRRCRPSCQILQTFLAESSELTTLYTEAHFRRRSISARIVAYTKPDSDMSAFLRNGARWAFAQAEVRA